MYQVIAITSEFAHPRYGLSIQFNYWHMFAYDSLVTSVVICSVFLSFNDELSPGSHIGKRFHWPISPVQGDCVTFVFSRTSIE